MATPTLAIMPPAAPPARPLSLYALEEDLEALLNTEETVEPDQQAEFAAHLESALATTKNKRDRVNHFLAHVESQAAMAASEIKRLQSRKSFFEAVLERVEGNVVRTIKNLGTDAKGAYKKLEGDTVTFSVRRCPATLRACHEINRAFRQGVE